MRFESLLSGSSEARGTDELLRRLRDVLWGAHRQRVLERFAEQDAARPPLED